MAEKSERLLNLYIMLLAQRGFVSKEKIRRTLYAGYADTPKGAEAFEKAFERDKDDLRELGVVIEVGSLDAYFEDEPGYRISADATSLPEITFEADEAAVLGLAARTWEQHTLARATAEALRKLTAQGVDVDASRLDLVPTTLRADEPAFETFWEAAQKRRVVHFDYRRPGEAPAERRVQPWGVVRSSGRWYAVGYDLDRQAERVFRLSRVTGTVAMVGKNAAYEIPEDADIQAVAQRMHPRAPDVTASVVVRQGSGIDLRRRALHIEEDVSGPDDSSGWDRLRISGQQRDLVPQLLSLSTVAVVESPAELRDAVVRRLRAAAGEEIA